MTVKLDQRSKYPKYKTLGFHTDEHVVSMREDVTFVSEGLRHLPD